MWKQELRAAVTSVRELVRDIPRRIRRTRPADVERAYALLFDRPPESPEVIQFHARSHPEVWSMLGVLMATPEFRQRAGDFAEPRTSFDWRALLARYERPRGSAAPGYVTDSLGLRTRADYLSADGAVPEHIEGLPVAGDLRCSTAERAAGLRGVELAREEFVVVELGAGWGAWMASLSRAAQIRGCESTLAIGCEADAVHCQMLREHMAVNGFRPEHYRLFEGAVGPASGVALFPKCEHSASDWGLRPVFATSEEEANRICSNPEAQADYRGYEFTGFDRVPCFSLSEIATDVDHVDVLHVDVQGTECELIEGNLELIQRLVGYLIVGTHGRAIEARLLETMTRAGWSLEVEEPCQFDLHHVRFAPRVDGVQAWRNPAVRG